VEIDQFTLIAQVINFLVLVWLLKRVFYGRIIGAMNEREVRIAGRLEEAADQRESAEQEAKLYRTRNRELEEQRGQLLAQAREEAESHRQELLEAARQETERAQVQWLETLNRERQELLRDFRERLGQEVFKLSRQGLKELANADLEEQILKVFVERVETLDAAEREAIATTIRDSDHAVEIRTAFPVDPEARECLSRSLRQKLDDRVGVRFTTAPELICGVELRAHSHRLVWNLDSYLEGLEARVFEALDESAKKLAQPQ
jgi:F-type H+-transporting ATPase subunit b